MELIEVQRSLDEWVVLNVQPFKHELLLLCSRWSLMFKQYIIDGVVATVTELDAFITASEAGLSQNIDSGSYDILVSVMSHLMAIRDRTKQTDDIFQPIADKIQLVQVMNIHM